MGKLTIVLLAACLTVPACTRNIRSEGEGFALREGDLLFQDMDCGGLCDAIEKVTTGYNGANLSHIGIAVTDANNNLAVIEAVQSGVVITPLEYFLDRSFDAGGRAKVLIGRLKPSFRHLIVSAVKEAIALKGKSYDKCFVIGNDAYYCSELVYEIFLRASDNKPLFALQPMTFNDPCTGVVFPVWQEYFSELGVPIPEGQLGINPGGISRSPVLSIVHIYGHCTRVE